MKYKIKNTGEIIEVIQCDIDGNNIVYTDVIGCGNNPYLNLYKDCDPIFEDKIDWENRRYEIAKAAMQGVLSSGKYGSCEKVIADSFVYADMFIKQLKQCNEAK